MNVGYQWGILDTLDALRGAVFLASGNNSARVGRKAAPSLRHVFFDPQLYLAGLDIETSLKKCSVLATHEWFRVEGVNNFDSSTGGQRAWESKVRTLTKKNWRGKAPEGDHILEAAAAAVSTQVEFGCTSILLPTPLLDMREDAGAILGEWLDAGLQAIEEKSVGQPAYATIALAESVLDDSVFGPAGFLDAVVSQVASRLDQLAGAYVVVAQSGKAEHPFQTSSMAWRGYVETVRTLRAAGVQRVITNFADVFGLPCIALGATGFATGPAQSTRRLSLEGFRDDGLGLPIPRLYSHQTIAEFSSETELGEVVNTGIFNLVKDVTLFSEELIDELSGGGSAANIPEWAESKNNVGASAKHFIARMQIECDAVIALGTLRKRSDHITQWLETAQTNMQRVRTALQETGAGIRVGPATTWRNLLR